MWQGKFDYFWDTEVSFHMSFLLDVLNLVNFDWFLQGLGCIRAVFELIYLGYVLGT